MKASNDLIKTILILNILFLGLLSSCEKDEKLEPMPKAQLTSQDNRLDTTSALQLNQPEMLMPDGIYVSKVFKKVKPVRIEQYGTGAEDKVEIFEAVGNFINNKPLVLLAPGGAWSSYTEMPKLRELATNLALKGYTVGLVQYFIDPVNPQTFDTYVKSYQDIRSAVRYFKLNSNKYRIDPDNIFIGGWSTGSVLSISAAYLEDVSELNEIPTAGLRNGLINSMNTLGFDNSDNPGVESDVRGVVVMMGYTLSNTWVDAGEPALMLVNHQNAHFTDGTPIIGTITYNGNFIYGTDPIATRALAQGFVGGDDFEYIRMTGPSPYKGSNQAPLWDGNYDNISDFIARNIL